MPRRLRLSKEADIDQLEIWVYTAEKFGLAQADRYKRLIGQALRDIARDPHRNGVVPRAEIAPDLYSYPISLSATRSGTRIHQARHFVLYLILSEKEIGVSRILHDSMEISRHIPMTHLQGEI